MVLKLGNVLHFLGNVSLLALNILQCMAYVLHHCSVHGLHGLHGPSLLSSVILKIEIMLAAPALSIYIYRSIFFISFGMTIQRFLLISV